MFGMAQLNEYQTPAEYARSVGVSRQLVYVWIANGRLRCSRVLGRLGIKRGTQRPKPILSSRGKSFGGKNA